MKLLWYKRDNTLQVWGSMSKAALPQPVVD